MKPRFIIFNILLFILATVSYAAKFIPPHSFIYGQFFTILTPLLIVVLIFVLWYSIKKKQRGYSIVNFLLLVIFLVGFSKHIGLHFLKEATVGNPRIKVINYNVDQYKTDHSFVKQIADLLAQQEPDIVCLEEFGYKAGRVNDSIIKYYSRKLGLPYSNFFHHRDNTYGLAMFSRYPITVIDTIYMPVSINNASVYYEINVNGEKLGLLHFHLYSFNINLNPDESSHVKLKHLAPLMKYAYIKQEAQLNDILVKAGKVNIPIIITGDLNNTCESYFYMRLASIYNDSFVKKGTGFGFTYPVYGIGVRIDYQFSKDLNILSHTVLNSNLSDHYPLVVEYSF